MISTYRFLAEFIQTQHYGGLAIPNAAITQKHIAERIAVKVAKMAKMSAFGNSNAGEATYSNDQFISVFYNQPLLTDSVTSERYIVMPATPVGLPNQLEIVQVSFVGCPDCHVIPMSNKDDFAQGLLPPLPSSMILYKVQDGNIVFKNLPKLVNAPVNIKMIGVISGPTLLDSVLNIPKDMEDQIVVEILQELTPSYNIKQQNIHTGEPS